MPEVKKSRSGPLVLYVDDEKGNRVVFEASLRDFNVLTAADATAALALLEVHEAAVVITDMRMPGLSGEELLRIVKERYPQTIRMVITAYSDVGPILRAINEGLVARYIVKPWQRNELVQVLRWATEAWTFSRDSAELHRRLLETERLATLGSLAGMFAHDLKQPLMSVLVNIEHLKELATESPTLAKALDNVEIDPDLKKRLRELVEDLEPVMTDITTAAKHLDSLITGLRDIGRPRDPTKPIPTIDPLPIVRHAMSVCQQLAIAGRSSIDYEGPRELPRVRMSPTELTQVLINIVANAAQAVAARGAANGKVSIVARANEETLELQVRDTGVGMPPEVLSRAGTPFFTTRAEGTGLGIAQCQRLVGTAGGRFKIESQEGVGTTVTITLPTEA